MLLMLICWRCRICKVGNMRCGAMHEFSAALLQPHRFILPYSMLILLLIFLCLAAIQFLRFRNRQGVLRALTHASSRTSPLFFFSPHRAAFGGKRAPACAITHVRSSEPIPKLNPPIPYASKAYCTCPNPLCMMGSQGSSRERAAGVAQ